MFQKLREGSRQRPEAALTASTHASTPAAATVDAPASPTAVERRGVPCFATPRVTLRQPRVRHVNFATMITLVGFAPEFQVFLSEGYFRRKLLDSTSANATRFQQRR